ncbi:hypothetical protein KR032_009437 [Drosophila birchii]|nr:hypothetical protein KR032_009437 [Drosophila birchii]
MCESQTNLLVKTDSSDGSVHPDGLTNYLVEDIPKHSERGLHEETDCSEPSCRTATLTKGRSSVDQRLEYWKNMFAQRRALQQKLRCEEVRDSQLRRPGSTGNLGVRCFKGDEGLPRHLSAEGLKWEQPREMLNEDRSLEQLEMLHETFRESQKEHLKCEPSAGLCMRINGVYFRPTVPEFPPIVEPYFICDPFQRLLRTVIRIENCGCLEMHFRWLRTEFFSNNDTLFRPEPGDFVFDTDPFFLAPGDIRDVSVLYQPRSVAIVKQRWLLVPRPQIFVRRPCAITLNIHGCCTAPKEFLERLAMEGPRVSMSLERKPPLDEPALLLCPYVRELEEREAFSQRNRSFQSRRHADMERLKKFFELVRPLNGFLVWNFSVHTLIHLVCAFRDAQERVRLFSELTHLLEGLRGAPGQSLDTVDTPERIRERWNTKMIYVRGILASRLQEWVDRMQLIRGPEGGCKYFHNSIYMLLHGLLCQAAEDIVSVIESTVEL